MAVYQDGDITIDEDFARFGSKSFAINKINTVDVREKKGSITPVLVLLIIFLLTATHWFEIKTFGSGAVALFFLACTALAWKFALITHYQLFLMTSSSQAQAYSTTDKRRVMKLREAIERSMIRRP